MIRDSGEKLNSNTFNRAWMECLLLAQERFAGLRTEIQQFEAEKIYWSRRCKFDPSPLLHYNVFKN